jgi:hypothetical protein
VLQLARPCAGGSAQRVHRAPQLLTLLSASQKPLQLCVPVVHIPLHALVGSMHAPLQSCMLPQFGTHASPSHDAVPPIGTWQGVHELTPQLLTSMLLTHVPPHR